MAVPGTENGIQPEKGGNRHHRERRPFASRRSGGGAGRTGHRPGRGVHGAGRGRQGEGAHSRTGCGRHANGEHGCHGGVPGAAARSLLRELAGGPGAHAGRPPRDVFLARRAGARGWLVKPLDPLRLRKAADELLEGGTYHDRTFSRSRSPSPSSPAASDPTEGDVHAATSCRRRPCRDIALPAHRGFWRRPHVPRRAPSCPTDRVTETKTRTTRSSTIITALNDLRDSTVREVMTPRVDVVGLPIPVQAADVDKACASPVTTSSPSTTAISTG